MAPWNVLWGWVVKMMGGDSSHGPFTLCTTRVQDGLRCGCCHGFTRDSVAVVHSASDARIEAAMAMKSCGTLLPATRTRDWYIRPRFS